MPRPTNPRKPEKLLSLPAVRADNPELAGQSVPMFLEPKGIDRYHASSRVDGEHAVKIRNLMLDDGVLVSRLGTDMMGGNAASTVLQVVDFVRRGQKKVTLRFCLRHIELFEYGLGAWRSFPIPLTGSEKDLFAYTGWADKLLFSNGVDGLWEFDFKTLVAKIVPGAPSAKHLTTFGNRVVACSTVEGGEDYPLRVRWTPKNIYDKWAESTEANPLTSDVAGGHEDLYGSPGGVTDEAIGVFPSDDTRAWLIRSQSVYQMSLSGNALAPFRFDRILAGIGTAFRHSAVTVPSGVVFASRDDIHLLTEAGHEMIGTFVIDDILEEGETLRNSYAAYDVGRREYRLAVDNLVWRYRFPEKAWTCDEYPFPIRSLSRQIQGVAGIPIDNLPGIIDDLSAAFPPGAINDLVYDRSFDDAMMFVPWSTELTVRETDETMDTLLTGEDTDSELLLETGVLNLDPLSAIELLGVHGEYESEMDQELIFEVSFDDGSSWSPYSIKDIEETFGSEMFYCKVERVSRKLRLRIRSLTLGKLRLLGIAPVLVKVQRSMAPKAFKPARLEILPSPLNLVVGGTQQLSWRVLGPGGQVLTGLNVTFVSTNNAIASVGGTGVVRAVAPGPFAIVASVRNVQISVSGTVTAATPAAVASVTVTPDISQGAAGSTQQFTATVRDANGAVLLGRTVVWASSSPGFATINSSGLASLVSVGTVAISATVEGVTGGATLSVTLAAATVATVELTPSTFSGDVGGTVQLTALPKDASDNILSGKTISWLSSAPGVATVNATGLVTFVGAGSVTITATCETISDTSTGTITSAVVPVASVAVTPSSFTKSIGQTQALTVVVRDGSGNALTGRSVSFASSNTSIATVDGSGVVTAIAAGSVVITAFCEGKSGSASATVTVAPVSTVSVNPSSFALGIGSSQQLTATLRDASNNILTGRTVVWGSSDVTKATVSSTGLVTAIAAGSVTITATSETKTGSSAATISTGSYSPLNAPSSLEYFAAPNPAGMVAELPRVMVNTNISAMTLTYASTVTLTDQGGRSQNTAKLQQYIDEAAARAGHSRINIANNVACDHPIIRFHSAGNYYTDIFWPNLPVLDTDERIITTDMVSAPVFWAVSGGDTGLQFDRKANNTRFNGIKWKAVTGVTIYDLIFVSPREGGSTDYDTDINNIPTNIHFNQCLVEGNDSGNGFATGNVRNGIALNARYGSICNSYIHQIGSIGTESHAVIIYNTPGPIKIVNNFLEATSINFLIGGAAPAYGRTVARPSDIEVRRNDFSKRLQWAINDGAWDGVTGRGIKNHIETKNAVRVLFEGNVVHNGWADGQTGNMVVFKSAEGSTTFSAPLEGSQDITFRYNIIKDGVRAFSFHALPDEPDALPGNKYSVFDNLVYNIGTFAGQTSGLVLLFTQNIDDMNFKHNTVLTNMTPVNVPMQLAYPNLASKSKRFVFSDNIINVYYVWSEGLSGTPAIDNWSEAASRVWERNVLVMPDNSLWSNHPQGTNQFLTTVAGVGFTNTGTGDYSLAGGSPYKGDGEGGSDPGCDMTKVNLATSGVLL